MQVNVNINTSIQNGSRSRSRRLPRMRNVSTQTEFSHLRRERKSEGNLSLPTINEPNKTNATQGSGWYTKMMAPEYHKKAYPHLYPHLNRSAANTRAPQTANQNPYQVGNIDVTNFAPW